MIFPLFLTTDQTGDIRAYFIVIPVAQNQHFILQFLQRLFKSPDIPFKNPAHDYSVRGSLLLEFTFEMEK